MSAIDDDITRALRTGTPSTGWDLGGFEIDAKYFLEAAGLCDLRITRDESPRSRLRIDAFIEDDDLGGAGARAIIVWCDALAYRNEGASEAHELTIDADVARLRFVTSAPGGRLVVTGELVIRKRRG